MWVLNAPRTLAKSTENDGRNYKCKIIHPQNYRENPKQHSEGNQIMSVLPKPNKKRRKEVNFL